MCSTSLRRSWWSRNFPFQLIDLNASWWFDISFGCSGYVYLKSPCLFSFCCSPLQVSTLSFLVFFTHPTSNLALDTQPQRGTSATDKNKDFSHGNHRQLDWLPGFGSTFLPRIVCMIVGIGHILASHLCCSLAQVRLTFRVDPF